MPIAVEPGENRTPTPTVRVGGGGLPYGTVQNPKRRRRKQRPQIVGGPTVGDLSIRNTIGNVPRAVSDAGIPNMQEFNRRLDAAVRAHRAVFGYDPTPGFAYDLVKVGLDERGYRRLLTSPKRPQLASPERMPSPAGVGAQFQDAAGGERVFGPTPGVMTRAAIFGSSGQARQAILDRAKRQDRDLTFAEREELFDLTQNEIAEMTDESGIAQVTRRFFEEGGEFFRQLPFGVWETLKAGANDATDFATAIGSRIVPELYRTPEGDVQHGSLIPRRTVEIAKQTGLQMWEDFRNPTEHPFNLVMDVFTIASAGAGVGVRVTRAGGALRAGEPEMAFLNLLRRPVPDTYTLGVGAMSAEIPRFENMALNIVVEPIRQARQQGLSERLTGGSYDAGPAKVTQIVSRYISAEAKLRRARFSRDAFLFKLDTVPAQQLDRAVRYRSVAQIVLRQAITERSAGLAYQALTRRAKQVVDKVVELAHLPVRDPVVVMRTAHERALRRWEAELADVRSQAAVGELSPNVAAARVADADDAMKFHQVELALINDAERVMTGQSRRLDPIVQQAARVSRMQEETKKQLLGWDDQMLANHLLEEAAFYQGLDYVPGEGYYIRTPEFPGDEEFRPSAETVDSLGRDLARAQGRLATLEKRQRERTQGVSKERSEWYGLTGVEMPERPPRPPSKALDRDIAAENVRITEIRARIEEAKGYLPQVAPLPGAELLGGGGRRIPFDVAPFYVPTRSQLFNTPSLTMEASTRGRGRFGLGPAQEPTPWHHQWTGQAFESGRRRIDTSDLLVEEARLVAKFATQRDQWEAAWGAARETPRGIPTKFVGVVRDIREIPDHLRKAVVTIEKDRLRHGESRALSDGKYDEVMRWLFPSKDDIVAGENVRYLDIRNVPEMAGVFDANAWRTFDKVMSSSANPLTWLNEAARITYLFARVAYAINFLGSGTLALIKQGPLAFENLYRAVTVEQGFGAYGAQVIRDAAGSGRTLSFETEKAAITKVSQTMAHFWSTLTDNKWREAAVIHELRRKDIRSEDGTAADFFARLEEGDPKARLTMTEAKNRALKSMVNFDNLTWPERAILRHIFFVYAWVSRSAVYSMHYLAEHPVQATWFSQAGEDYEETVQRLVGKVPEWFLRSGYIPVWKSFVSNPIQFNVPGSLAEIAYPLASMFAEVKYADMAETLDPSWKLLIDAITGDERALESGTLLEAFKEAGLGTPFGAAYERTTEGGDTPPPVPVVPPQSHGIWNMLSDAVRREKSGEDDATFATDGFWNQWGLLIAGSVTPREANELALRARHWRDVRESDPEAYIDHQVQMAQAMIARQGKLIGQPVTPEIREAVRLLGLVAAGEHRVEDESGMEGSLGARSKLVVTINVLRNNGYITASERTELIKQADLASTDPGALRRSILLEQGGLGKLNEWVTTVKQVGDLQGAKLAEAVGALKEAGAGSYEPAVTAPQPARRAYALRMVDYLNERSALEDRLEGQSESQVAAALNQFDAENGRPVTIQGVRFPSLAHARWATQSPKEREASLGSAANALYDTDWAAVSPVEKELLGRPVSGKVTAGWAAYQQALDAYRDEHGARARISREQKRALARSIDRDRRYTGFLSDFEFSQRTPLRRFTSLSVYQRSENRPLWDELFRTAVGVERLLEQARSKEIDQTMTQIRQAWAGYVENEVLGWVAEQNPAFQDEVDRVGETFLKRLIG